ncbi:MAG: glycosyltransferase family 2 protein [Blautia massiliensis (ex Durand et al. 2017)]
MLEEKPKISVIVPVYKAETTLDACVRSILSQTFDDFELLLVDDESPDSCPVLCDSWARQDRRIQALHPAKDGIGPSGARNAGLEAAQGEWITMVDSDDVVSPDLFATLYAAAQQSGAGLVICNGCQMLPDGTTRKLPEEQRFEKDTILTEPEFWDAFNTPWISQFTGTAHRLYAARLFEGVRYPVGMLHEDYYVLPDLIARCGKIQCLAYTGYYVRQHEGSITATGRHELRLAVTSGDIHRAEYFLSRDWYDRAEGALTDAAEFLYRNRKAPDLQQLDRRAEFAEVRVELCRVYAALAARKGSFSLKVRALALRAGLPVFHAYTRLLRARRP